MTQRTLFDNPTRKTIYDTPIARTTDPETSHGAAEKVSRKSDTERFIESCKWFQSKGGTAKEISWKSIPDELELANTQEFQKKRASYAERIRKRAADAVRTKMVKVQGKRGGCQVYIHKDFWEVNDGN